jgi:hypothetical protein
MLARNSVQKLLFSNLLYKIINIKIRTWNYNFVVVERHRTWTLTLRKEHKLRMSEKMVLRETLGPKEDEITEDWMGLQKELREL